MSMLDARTKTRTAPLGQCLSIPAPLGSLDVFWLGQAGFALRSSNALIVIDPYLSDALAEKYRNALFTHQRMMDAPIRPDGMRGVDLLLATHAHSDHLDPGGVGVIMALNPGCRLVCPSGAVPKAIERGASPDRLEGMKAFEKRRFGAALLELLPSAHEELSLGPDGDTDCAGFVIETEGMRLYHSGDCVPFDGLAELLRRREIDMALLPVNGRDARRRENGVPGNFTLDEAAELCLAAGIGFLVPHHFGMFEFNTIAPEAIASGLEKYRRRGLGWFIPGPAAVLSVRPARASTYRS